MLFTGIPPHTCSTRVRHKPPVPSWRKGRRLDLHPLDNIPLDIHPVHPGGKVLVIPEQGRSLDTGATLSSSAHPVHSTVTVLTDEETGQQEKVFNKGR